MRIRILDGLLLATSLTLLSAGDLLAGEISDWHTGLWWITESHVFLNAAEVESGPRKPKDTVFMHKWIVERIECLGSETNWVVSIYPYMLPKDVQNDHGEACLFKLWIGASDHALRKMQTSFREGTYLVTGPLRSQSTVVYTNRAPVAVLWPPEVCPLDAPLLPTKWQKPTVASIMQTAKDERSGKDLKQEIEAVKDRDAIRVKLQPHGHEARIQTWSDHYPWWSEWHCPEREIARDGLWYSKVIDWQGRPGK